MNKEWTRKGYYFKSLLLFFPSNAAWYHHLHFASKSEEKAVIWSFSHMNGVHGGIFLMTAGRVTKGDCTEKFRTITYIIIMVLQMQLWFSNWGQVEVQVQHGWGTVSWFHYPKYHEHSSVQDYPTHEDNNKMTRSGKKEGWALIVTSKSEGRRVCTVKSVRPMNPVTACGLEIRREQKLYSIDSYLLSKLNLVLASWKLQ